MLDLSGYPPAPVVWAYTGVDCICDVIGCSDWRQTMVPTSWTAPTKWLSEDNRLTSVHSFLPPMLSYHDFLEQQQQQQQQQNHQHPLSLDHLKTFAFSTPSTTLADLTTPEAMLVLFFLVLLLRQIKAIFIPFFSSLGRLAGRATHGTEWEAANEVRIIKFGEYVFRLVFHSTISIAGIVYFWDKEWWKPGGTKTLWMNYPFHQVEPGMTWYYLVQSAYNLEAFLSLMQLSFSVRFATFSSTKSTTVPSGAGLSPTTMTNKSTSSRKTTIPFPIRIEWSPTVRGDFREMFIHHVVTNLLVVGSSFFRLTRIGSMVFLVHDISDVPVDLSKLANFLKWKATTAFFFGSMVLVWMATRLGILPFTIYWSVLKEGWMVTLTGDVTPIHFICYRHFFNVLMGLLILLHMAWFSMFIKMGYTLIRKGEAHDYSEHKRGEKGMVRKEKDS